MAHIAKKLCATAPNIVKANFDATRFQMRNLRAQCMPRTVIAKHRVCMIMYIPQHVAITYLCATTIR